MDNDVHITTTERVGTEILKYRERSVISVESTEGGTMFGGGLTIPSEGLHEPLSLVVNFTCRGITSREDIIIADEVIKVHGGVSTCKRVRERVGGQPI